MIGLRPLALAAALLLGAGVALAASGHVVDPDGNPIKGAGVCTIAAEQNLLCAETDAEGYYSLPPGGDRVRIRSAGYLIETVAAIARDEPVRLRPAAKLEARFVDAAGAPVSGVSFYLSRPDGRRHGPLGPTNATGIVIVSTLEPGEALLSAAGDGYEPSTGHPVALRGGRTTTLTVRLKRTEDGS